MDDAVCLSVASFASSVCFAQTFLTPLRLSLPRGFFFLFSHYLPLGDCARHPPPLWIVSCSSDALCGTGKVTTNLAASALASGDSLMADRVSYLVYFGGETTALSVRLYCISTVCAIRSRINRLGSGAESGPSGGGGCQPYIGRSEVNCISIYKSCRFGLPRNQST